MFEIADWQRYEVNSKGSPATDTEDLRAGPLKFVRLKVHGHSQSNGYRMLLHIAKDKTMEVFGIFCKFLEISGDSRKGQRGILRRERDGEPATVEDLAFLLAVSEAKIKNAFKVLIDKRLRWVTVIVPGDSQKFPEIPENTPLNTTQYNPTQDKSKQSKPIQTNKKKVVVEFPSNLDTPEFKNTWKEWECYRTETKKKLTPSTVKKQLKMLSEHTAPEAVVIIEKSIRNGWQGLFPERNVDGEAKGPDNRAKLIAEGNYIR